MNNMTLKQMAVATYRKEVPTNFSIADMEGALRDKFRELAPDFNTYRRNKLTIFEIIQEVVDAVLPNRIQDTIGMFAEVKSYAQGVKPRFRKKLGKKNIKRFITKVGLNGTYERVRLDKEQIDISAFALGGAVYCEFEEFLDGVVSFEELIDAVIDGIQDEIYKEIQTALKGTLSSLPAANTHTDTDFDSAGMKKIITTVLSYGGNANIICTPEFAATITPDSSFIGDADKADVRNQGYIGKFAGANVVVLPQSFEDETNTTKVFDAQYAYIIPTGGSADERIVKVLLEGNTIMREVQNADWSMEFQAYKKAGTAILSTNFYGIYKNTSL